MGKKSKAKRKEQSASQLPPDASPSDQHTTTNATSLTVSDLRNDANLWYKILVLIYDLKNIAQDKSSQDRNSQTVHELYLSAPYFTSAEEVQVRGALVDGLSVEEAITRKLEDFFEKRRASGDARPCGPHDMVPVYVEVFGVEKEELGNENFLRRVRRNGLR